MAGPNVNVNFAEEDMEYEDSDDLQPVSSMRCVPDVLTDPSLKADLQNANEDYQRFTHTSTSSALIETSGPLKVNSFTSLLRRGLAICFLFTTFFDDSLPLLPHKPYVDMLRDKLMELTLNAVEVIVDCDRKDFFDRLKWFLEMAQKVKPDYILVFISSHGVNRHVFLPDATTISLLADVVNFLDGGDVHFAKIPRVYFFDACRLSDPIQLLKESHRQDHVRVSPHYIFSSCSEGEYATFCEKKGSHFTRSFLEVARKEVQFNQLVKQIDVRKRIIWQEDKCPDAFTCSEGVASGNISLEDQQL